MCVLQIIHLYTFKQILFAFSSTLLNTTSSSVNGTTPVVPHLQGPAFLLPAQTLEPWLPTPRDSFNKRKASNHPKHGRYLPQTGMECDGSELGELFFLRCSISPNMGRIDLWECHGYQLSWNRIRFVTELVLGPAFQIAKNTEKKTVKLSFQQSGKSIFGLVFQATILRKIRGVNKKGTQN